MRLVFLAVLITCCNLCYAQLAPDGDFKAAYVKELKKLETQLSKGDDAAGANTLLLLMQMQEKHTHQLGVLLKKAEDKDDIQDISDRIEEETERRTRLKEMSGEILANKQEILEDVKDFLEE